MAEVRRRTIVTGWFRVPAVWPLLVDHLRQATQPVTVVCAGVGTGEEAWSAAILLAEAGIRGRVLASDVDVDLLATAEAGRYSAESLAAAVDLEATLTAAQRERWFVDDGAGYNVVERSLRKLVTFAMLDLASDDALPADAALVRNVWRHLATPHQEALARRLHAALQPDGLLLVGGGDFFTPAALSAGADVAARCISAGRAIDAWFEPAGHHLVRRPREGMPCATS